MAGVGHKRQADVGAGRTCARLVPPSLVWWNDRVGGALHEPDGYRERRVLCGIDLPVPSRHVGRRASHERRHGGVAATACGAVRREI